ncbi:MAG: hypothetical protein JEZ08_16380 [Clostridiales bacterium]|nr:hypothetical protein [Clostridiales bacterium]
MEKLVLDYIDTDSWCRPVYKGDDDKLYKDVDCDSGKMNLCTVSGGVDSETDTPLSEMNRYKNTEVIINRAETDIFNGKFDYMILSRLQSDCDYYLGYGNRSEKRLYNGNVEEHIQQMKDLYNSFSTDEKPDWLTIDKIMKYEELMTENVEQ